VDAWHASTYKHPMTPWRRNLELKARYPDLDRARAAVRTLGAAFDRAMQQVDTYFRVTHGRLKLREIDRQRAELIYYDRPDSIAYRGSEYIVVPVPDPAALKSALGAACGLRGQVHKHRELWLYHNVRIHLDRVEQLGQFIEFEAVLQPGENEATSLERLQILHDALGLQESEKVAGSYGELLGF
jgi:adenylate cyclase class 2